VTSVCESCADWWEKVKERKREEGKQTCWVFFWKSPLSTNTLTLTVVVNNMVQAFLKKIVSSGDDSL
jgi:hypothetical protein